MPHAGGHVQLFGDGDDSIPVRPDGTFMSEGLDPGVYFAVHSQLGFVPQLFDGMQCLPGFCDPILGTPIVVGLDETVEGVEFTIEEQGKIQGRVTRADTGEPVRAEVQLWNQNGESVARVTSFSDGTYEAGLATGKYYVVTDSPSEEPHLDELYPDVPCPGQSCHPGNGQMVEVRLGEETPDINFELLPLTRSPCYNNPRSLCLNRGRFQVEATWRSASGDEGMARVERLTDDSAYFWILDENDAELVVKLLDGCFDPFQSFWFFAAGLTDVEVMVHVTDTFTDERRTYENPPGTAFAPILDTQAFDSCIAAGRDGPMLRFFKPMNTNLPVDQPLKKRSRLSKPGQEELFRQVTCRPTETAHCLSGDRFRVEARWRTPDGREGTARTALALEDTGFFWFFDKDNIELAVRILDACTIDGFNNFKIFTAGLTDVEVALSVTDTVTGQTWENINPEAGSLQPTLDEVAFGTCSSK